MTTPRVWRLISEDQPRPGAWNMAIDRALMETCGTQVAPPTLRIYSWAPPAVSLGKGQSAAVVDWAKCQSDRVEVVRRPTGGWAIFHSDELTYSVAAHADEPGLAGPLLEAYRALSDGLIAGLDHLGLPAQLAPSPSAAEKAGLLACFEVPYNNEITVEGKKLMGSAQARSGRKLLQHGSLPLEGDVGRAADYLLFVQTTADGEMHADDAARAALRTRLREHATTASAAAGRPITFAEAAAAMVKGFAATLGIVLEPGTLTLEEDRLARDYLATFAVTDPDLIAHQPSA